MSNPAPVAVLGGTFNPIHYGHLRSAGELLERLTLAELRFMPSASPPHRDAPDVSAEDRAAMVELAIAQEPRFYCDRRELRRAGPSYSYDSLREIRTEVGEQCSLALVIGCDAFLQFPQWRRYEDFWALAHVVVMARPGWSLPDEGEAFRALKERRVDETQLRREPAGGLLPITLAPQDISATRIRSLLQSGASVRDLIPENVAQYIEQRQLYRRR